MNKTLEKFFSNFKRKPPVDIAELYLSGAALPANHFKGPDPVKVLSMATPKNCWACPVNFDCELKPIRKCPLYQERRGRGIIWADWWEDEDEDRDEMRFGGAEDIF